MCTNWCSVKRFVEKWLQLFFFLIMWIYDGFIQQFPHAILVCTYLFAQGSFNSIITLVEFSCFTIVSGTIPNWLKINLRI